MSNIKSYLGMFEAYEIGRNVYVYYPGMSKKWEK
jgi:hypothetical protein